MFGLTAQTNAEKLGFLGADSAEREPQNERSLIRHRAHNAARTLVREIVDIRIAQTTERRLKPLLP